MNRYELILSNGFKRDLKLAVKRRRNISKLEKVVEMLLTGEPMPEKYEDHKLTGNWVGHRECHIEPDWLLIYYIENDVLTLTLTRTGTHCDLFLTALAMTAKRIPHKVSASLLLIRRRSRACPGRSNPPAHYEAAEVRGLVYCVR